MVKVIVINNEMGVGGTEKVLLTILEYLDKEKFNITVLLPAAGDIWECKIPSNVKIKYIFKRHPREFNKFFKKLYYPLLSIIPGKIIQKVFIKDEYDIYISFKEVMVDYLRGSKGKKICWIHRDYSNYNYNTKGIKGLIHKWLFILNRRSFNLCDKIICVSESARKAFIDKFEIDEEKVICRYNPNNVKQIKMLSQEPIDIYLDNDINMCAVGRLDKIKAFHRLINIGAKLKDEGIKFNLMIIGDGPEYDNLKSLINQKKLSKYIKLIGFSDNPYKFISKSDFMVCSSLSEAFSTVATESIILGVPVITTLCSGMKELLLSNKCGLITENNEEDLFLGIKNVIEDNKLLNSITKEANKRSNDFDTVILINRIEEILLENK